MADINQEFKEMDNYMKKARTELSRMEAERDLAKENLSKEIEKLKELGISFKNKEQLENEYKETVERTNIMMESLKRKIDEYEDIKNRVEEIEETEEKEKSVLDEFEDLV